MKNKNDFRHLFSLLDDEDENVAVAAMAELLDHEEELGDGAAAFQESENPLMRRRIHQLQAAITVRRRRRLFARRFAGRKFDLAEALIETHLLWFDNDGRPMLEEMVDSWKNSLAAAGAESLEDLAEFMVSHNCYAREECTTVPELYCIGPVLENRGGASSMLCAVLKALAPKPERFLIAAEAGEFALIDVRRKLALRPLRSWRIAPYRPECWRSEFSNEALIRYFAMTLFGNAVNSDSFRYVLTIAQSLTGEPGSGSLRSMPYPYYPADEEENEDI